MTQELSATSILSLFETTKEQRESFAASVVNELGKGSVDPLKVHLQVKCLEDVIKSLNSNTNYRSSILDAAQLQGQKSFSYHSAKFEIKETGTKYDFSKCEDPKMVALYEKQAKIDKEVKERETMLKTISQKGLIITDEETGETYTVYPPAKSSTTSVAVTLK